MKCHYYYRAVWVDGGIGLLFVWVYFFFIRKVYYTQKPMYIYIFQIKKTIFLVIFIQISKQCQYRLLFKLVDNGITDFSQF